MDGFRYKMEKRIFGISNFFHEYVVFEVQGFVEASHAIHLGLSLNIYETSYMSIVVNHLFPNAEFVVVPLHSNRQTKFFNIKQFNGRNVIRKPTWKNNLTHLLLNTIIFYNIRIHKEHILMCTVRYRKSLWNRNCTFNSDSLSFICGNKNIYIVLRRENSKMEKMLSYFDWDDASLFHLLRKCSTFPHISRTIYMFKRKHTQNKKPLLIIEIPFVTCTNETHENILSNSKQPNRISFIVYGLWRIAIDEHSPHTFTKYIYIYVCSFVLVLASSVFTHVHNCVHTTKQ